MNVPGDGKVCSGASAPEPEPLRYVPSPNDQLTELGVPEETTALNVTRSGASPALGVAVTETWNALSGWAA